MATSQSPPSEHDAITVAIVAAFASIRAGLAAFLDCDPQITIVAQASSWAELVRLSHQAALGVVLIDVHEEQDAGEIMPAAVSLNTCVVMLHDHPEDILPYVRQTSIGWALLGHDADGREIAAAIKAAAAGLVVVDQNTAAQAFALPAASEVGKPDDSAPQRASELTAREREVLHLMADGLPNKVIAARLAISLHTAKFHVASILAKLGASSRTEAVRLGIRQGLVSY